MRNSPKISTRMIFLIDVSKNYMRKIKVKTSTNPINKTKGTRLWLGEGLTFISNCHIYKKVLFIFEYYFQS